MLWVVHSFIIQFTVKDLDFRTFWQFRKYLDLYFHGNSKTCSEQTCRWRSNMQWWWDGLVSFYSPLSITAQDIAFFIKTHLSLTLNLDIWRNVLFCDFFLQDLGFSSSLCTFFYKQGVLALCYFFLEKGIWNLIKQTSQ